MNDIIFKTYQTTEQGSYNFEGLTIPNSEGNRHYQQMLAEVAEGNAEILTYVEPPLTDKQVADALKMSGVLFEGVLCSAEAEDMWGLNSIQGFIAAGNSTPFVFRNGNTLVITPQNLADFQAVWIPFRLGFFK